MSQLRPGEGSRALPHLSSQHRPARMALVRTCCWEPRSGRPGEGVQDALAAVWRSSALALRIVASLTAEGLAATLSSASILVGFFVLHPVSLRSIPFLSFPGRSGQPSPAPLCPLHSLPLTAPAAASLGHAFCLQVSLSLHLEPSPLMAGLLVLLVGNTASCLPLAGLMVRVQCTFLTLPPVKVLFPFDFVSLSWGT